MTASGAETACPEGIAMTATDVRSFRHPIRIEPNPVGQGPGDDESGAKIGQNLHLVFEIVRFATAAVSA